jgi:hypothetical protein
MSYNTTNMYDVEPHIAEIYTETAERAIFWAMKR